MNEPKTPNLGLNKIDRSSPSTTYFDLDKYLDQNWEKVDGFAEQVEEKVEETAAQVSNIQERLDTEKRRSVTLEPGLQIINAERASPFKLEGLKGRTLVNLLGRDGNFEDAMRWNVGLGTRTVANNVITVTGNGTGVNPQLTSYNHILALTPKVGDKLFLRVRATHIIGTAKQLQLYLWSTALNRFTAINIDNPVNGTTYDMYGVITVNQAVVDGWDTTFGFKLTAEYDSYEASNGSQVQFSNAAIYKVSDEDKSLTSNQLALKYPYVDSLQPVRNPYTIRYGENLLPPFYEWRINDGVNSWVEGPYTLSGVATKGNQPTDSPLMRVPIGTTLTLTGGGNGANGYMQIINKSKTAPLADNAGSEYALFTATEENNEFYVRAQVMDAGPHTIKNPMLSIGSVPKPFKPREDAMLALQTDLYADPVTGANADEVFEKGGQYFKLAKWGRVALDDSLGWAVALSPSGFKQIEMNSYNFPITGNQGYTTKYNGAVLPNFSGIPVSADLGTLSQATGRYYVTVANLDSGWGDAYTPTAAEIKAYFKGWKMGVQGGSRTAPYEGTGSKIWYKITMVTINGSATLQLSDRVLDVVPTVPAGTDSVETTYTPYQLVYQLATPTVEPITSEGQLTFFEGNNQVEAGTGLVIREGTKPAFSTLYNTYEINSNINNSGSVAANPLIYKVKKINSIYKNGKPDQWLKMADVNSYGLERAYKSVVAFNPSAIYTVTYFMLDTFPVAPFVGSVAENERTLLTDMSDIIRQNAAAVSVVEAAINEAVRQLKQQNKRDVWGVVM